MSFRRKPESIFSAMLNIPSALLGLLPGFKPTLGSEDLERTEVLFMSLSLTNRGPSRIHCCHAATCAALPERERTGGAAHGSRPTVQPGHLSAESGGRGIAAHRQRGRARGETTVHTSKSNYASLTPFPQFSAKSKTGTSSFLTGLNLSFANFNNSSVTSGE